MRSLVEVVRLFLFGISSTAVSRFKEWAMSLSVFNPSLRNLSTFYLVERGPGSPPPFFLDQTEARRAENIFRGYRPPPYLRVWMTPPPPAPTHNLISVETHHMSSLRLEMSRSIIQIADNVSFMYIYPANLPFLSNEGKMCLIRTQPRR